LPNTLFKTNVRAISINKKRFQTSLKCWNISTVVWTPYFPTVLDAWAIKDHPNMLFLFYEDMKKVIQ
jgi:hypothetical protein